MIKNGLIWFFNIPREYKRVLSVVGDSLLLSFALWAALSLRYDALYVFSPEHLLILAGVIPLTIMVFARIGLYRAVIRFMGHQAIASVFWGVLASTLLLVAASFLVQADMPRSVPLIYWTLAMVLTGGSRMAIRSAIHLFGRKIRPDKEPVVIYGAGAAGCQLATALMTGPEFHPVAFLDDDNAKLRTIVKGLPVHSPVELGQLIENRKVQRVLLAISNASHVQRSLILRFLEDFPVKVQTIPGMADLVKNPEAITQLRDIDVEDLLGRDPVPPKDHLLEKSTKGKVVLVSGAGGSIGSELCRQAVQQGAARLVMVDVSEFALYEVDKELRRLIEQTGSQTELLPVMGSVQKEHRMEVVMRSYGVQVVYHAAAYKHVPLVEQNVVEGVRNNVFGTWFVAEAAIRAGVDSFVLVSTDKAVRPTNVMGASKRFAELVLQGISNRAPGTRFTMVRFGNVLGSSGSVVPLFRQQIREGGPVTVTHPEVIRYFMTIPEAASLVIQAGAMGRGGEVFLLDMGQPVRIADLARKMIRLMGHEVRTAEHPEGIDLVYTGLRPGEKLYEELLVGDNSETTSHPRIMKAHEESLDWAATHSLLTSLDRACHHFDCNAVRDVLLRAPLAYQPESDCADLVWKETGQVQLFVDDDGEVGTKLAG